jgi:ribose 5-phosphate isomerase A
MLSATFSFGPERGMSEELKRRAAEAALAYVEDGMRLGLGTGSTAAQFVTLLGERVQRGLRVVGVATSDATERLARQAGISISSLDETPELDLDIDGADEIGPGLALIKGGGGALLREKIVAQASARMIVIAEASKQVPALGAFPLPIEVVGFGLTATALAVERTAIELGLTVAIDLRQRDGIPFVTDSGNRILDASFGRIPDPETLASRLAEIPGIVEHGLFLNFADLALVASDDGVAEIGPEPLAQGEEGAVPSYGG